MNSLTGEIIDVASTAGLSIVKVKCGHSVFTALVISEPTSNTFVRHGARVLVHFKETEVMIGIPGPLEISVQNKIPCTIKKMEEGKILTQLTLTFEGLEIVSIITSNAVKQLKLEAGAQVIALIKTNEVTLSNSD
jgi:molybdopterin-binding protein